MLGSEDIDIEEWNTLHKCPTVQSRTHFPVRCWLASHLQYAKDILSLQIASSWDGRWPGVWYNGIVAETPNLDAMASGQHSVCMTRFYSGAPVCSPTRCTVLTGWNNRYCIWSVNNAHGCSDGTCPGPQGMPLATSEITVAKILKRHNYCTAAFGKWHLGDLAPCNCPLRVPILYGQRTSNPGMHVFDIDMIW